MNINKKIKDINHQRIDQSRKLKIFLFNLIFGPFTQITGLDEAASILVLRMDDKLGDSITATGFLRSIKNNLPNNKLIVVSGSVSSVIYKKFDFIDEVIVSKKGFINTLMLFFKLNSYKYRAIINTSHILNPRVLFLTSQLSANKKISFENRNSKVFNEFVTIDFKTEHVTLRYKKALEILGFKNKNLTYEVKIDDNALSLAQKYVLELKKDGKIVIVLNSFAGGKLRNFSYEKSREIVTEVLKNFNAVVISIANKGDHQILAQWMSKAQITSWVANSEFNSIDMNVALVSLADIVVTPDTAWVHIASALNKKLVAVYRVDKPDDKELNSVIWAPRSEYFEVVFTKPESITNEDINAFKISEVIDAIKKIMVNK